MPGEARGSFYLCWLPISLAMHAVGLVCLYFLPVRAATGPSRAPETLQLISLAPLPAADAPAPETPRPPVHVPRPPAPRPSTLPPTAVSVPPSRPAQQATPAQPIAITTHRPTWSTGRLPGRGPLVDAGTPGLPAAGALPELPMATGTPAGFADRPGGGGGGIGQGLALPGEPSGIGARDGLFSVPVAGQARGIRPGIGGAEGAGGRLPGLSGGPLGAGGRSTLPGDGVNATLPVMTSATGSGGSWADRPGGAGGGTGLGHFGAQPAGGDGLGGTTPLAGWGGRGGGGHGGAGGTARGVRPSAGGGTGAGRGPGLLANAPPGPGSGTGSGAGQGSLDRDVRGLAGVPGGSGTATTGNWSDRPGSGGAGGSGFGLQDPATPNYPAAVVGGPAPSYPSLAAKERLQGTVVLAVTIDSDGHAAGITFVQRSNSDVLDNEALRTARLWRYQAGMADGKAVGGVVKLQVVFAVGKPPVMSVVR